MVIDCFTFFNELDILELRFNILDEHVDYFMLTESVQTFSGKPKPLYYEENKERFKKWNHKVLHIEIDEMDTDDAFDRAHVQKTAALNLISDPEATVYFGDVDEIWTPQNTEEVIRLKQHNYGYYLNNLSSEEWYGTIVGKRKHMTDFNIHRSDAPRSTEYGGWHFTNMGGLDQIKKKLDAYDHQEFNNDTVKHYLERMMKENKDYIGRKKDTFGNKIEFKVDESAWPEYLKNNREKYIHLCK